MTFIDKQKVARFFSKSASKYESVNHVQRKMASRLLELLHKETDTQQESISLLEIGCGTGWLTSECIKHFTGVKIDAVDISQQMLAEAQKKISAHFPTFTNIQYLQADIENVALDQLTYQKYDLIISNATFQWLNEPTETIKRISKWLKPNGLMLFSTFGPDTFYELHQSFQLAATELGFKEYSRRGLEYYAKEDWFRCLKGLFPQLNIYQEKEVDYYPTVQNFLYAIKKMGANYSPASQNLTKSYYQTMKQKYEELHWTNEGIPATYDCFYVVCK